MTRRFLATAEAQWPQPQPKFFTTSLSTTLKEYFDLYSKLHDGSNEIMIGLMLGDYQRTKDYVDLGFSVVQPKSADADMAFDEFISKNSLMDIDESVVIGGVVVKGVLNLL